MPTSTCSKRWVGSNRHHMFSNVCTLLTERSQVALPHLVAADFVADAAFVDGRSRLPQ